ncbi:hypothetical protein [Brevifollis gellanilyticus]|uniref:Uncharacterized protein n=1 Tax=Brevifollis gellanilyticus TaxID=748831 RepID=A0A512M3G1_9BACT|nr:hypothetical protein [Brevifollis gellanilyticus]GEP41287.1 hypothetical protein BGE01nite_05780 [Brevifollis gellanilyticus]
MIRSILSTLVLLVTLASASQLGLMTVKQPLYMHGSDSDPEIEITDVPVASSGSYPESFFAAIHTPFTPPTDGSWKEPENVNMTSLYGIRVSAELDSAGDVELWKITVDASKAKQPEGYPFTVAQVLDATVTCVKIMCPYKPEDERKVTIKVVQPKK